MNADIFRRPSFGLNAPLQQGRFNQYGDINFYNSFSSSTEGYSLPMGFQTSDTPDSAVGMHDSVSTHIPLKVEEKIWRGEYIHFRVLLKSAKELAYFACISSIPLPLMAISLAIYPYK
jgi:hypothetical protein